MRAPAVIVLALALPALAGCLGQTAPVTPTALGALDPASIAVPAGAVLEALPGGAALVWKDVPLPFDADVPIPQGATLVRLTAEVPEGLPLTVSMVHAETGRRRCNAPNLEPGAWNLPIVTTKTCSGLTAVDELPTAWRMRANAFAAAGLPLMAADGVVAKAVRVELLAAPLDGAVALLNLDLLSQRTHELEPTEALYVESFDGTPLFVEVTKPKGDGPWPVVISSSPYSAAEHAAGVPAMWQYWVRDWAERGYVAVQADVRGYGQSGGCVEVWSANEQQDQAALVEWAAAQPWSDGNVGFYGQSYVGTTPVAAATLAPEALKAIITIAPVINAYDDWHFGGVPNGENLGSPMGYMAIGVESNTDLEDPLWTAMTKGNGLCNAAMVAEANDPRALYDAFYAERNFSARVSDVKAAVLYTQGWLDSNVKSAMITHWFNALQGPKLGVFGPWTHQHPVRADQEVLFLAWFDQHLKGKPMGLEALPAVLATSNDFAIERAADAWPPLAPERATLHADFAGGALSPEPAEGSGQLILQPTRSPLTFLAPTDIPLEVELPEDLHMAGQPVVRLKATLTGGANAYVAAWLFDMDGSDISVVTWGMANLAHRFGHDRYEPVLPGEMVTMELPLLPTEHVFKAGRTLHLHLRGAHVSDWSFVDVGQPGVLTLEGGQDGTALVLPLAPAEGVRARPVTAQP